MRAYLALFGLVLFISSNADQHLHEIDLPIDTKQKAIDIVVRDVFYYTSCASMKFETTVEEFEFYWTVTSTDVSPPDEAHCATQSVSVCKENGEIVYRDTRRKLSASKLRR